MSKKLVAVVGPTASGKTKLGVLICKKLNGEIISADSRQVYRGLDIGTGKEGEIHPNHPNRSRISPERIEFIKRRARWVEGVPQYLIDIVEPGKPARHLPEAKPMAGGELYNLALFLKDAKIILDDIWKRRKLPIVVGGTGLYVSGLLRGYQLPTKKLGRGKWYKKVSPSFESLILGIKIPRPELYKKIDERVDKRIEQGMIKEVESLLQKEISPKWLISLGLEYKYITLYIKSRRPRSVGIPYPRRYVGASGGLGFRVEGLGGKEEMIEKLKFASHHFARRQLTWLRHQLPGVRWIESEKTAIKLVEEFLRKR